MEPRRPRPGRARRPGRRPPSPPLVRWLAWVVSPILVAALVGSLLAGRLARRGALPPVNAALVPDVAPTARPTAAARATPPLPPTSPEELARALADETSFALLSTPQPGEWRDSFKEPTQSFAEYLADRPHRPDAARGVLVFVPVGPFDERAWRTFRLAVECAGLYFQMPTRIEPARELPPERFSRERTWGRQYLTGYFIQRLLPRTLPDDAYAYLAVTMADLYPGPDFNYLFGQASFTERVGVYSLVRFFPDFWHEPATPESETLALRRSCQLITHELGHAFGLAHCQRWHCNENGTNSLEETDRAPLGLCPDCLQKLQWNTGFDILRRYRALADFCAAHGLVAEADWYRERMKLVRPAASP